jgi:hypothetical protein
MRGGRIGFAALALAGVLLPLWKRSGSVSAVDQLVDHGAQLNALTLHEYTAATVWSQFSQRDSALAYLDHAATPTGPVPQVVFQGFPAGISAPKTVATVNALWRAIGPTDSALNVVVLVQNEGVDQVSKFEWGRYRGALFAERGGRNWCVAIVGGYAYSKQSTVSVNESSLETATSPCALRAAFGQPGTAIAEWLTATRYLEARSNDWLTRPRDFRDQFGPFERMRNTSVTDFPYNAFFQIASGIGALDLAELLRPPYDYGADGVRCLGRHASSCATTVLHPAAAEWVDRLVPPDMTMPAYLRTGDSATFATVRTPSPTFIAGLIGQYGRDRFRQFWTSDQPFEIAFQRAFDESLGEGVERWAKSQWLATHDAEFRSAEILTGATLRLSWIPLLAIYSALAVLIAVSVARRRQA